MKPPKFLNQVVAHFNSPQGRKTFTNLKIGVVNGGSAFVTEILFLMVPVIVLAMIHLHKESGQNIWSIPEWSFITAVLFGQAIIRMFEVLGEVGRSFNPTTTSAVAALVIVLGLIPSLVILSLILLTENPSNWLIIGQFFMFGLSILTLLTFTFFKHVAREAVELIEILWPDYVEPRVKVLPKPE